VTGRLTGGPQPFFEHDVLAYTMGPMNTQGLRGDWFVTPGIDLELKRYVLLAYLQRIRARFRERKLYPHLEELRAHLELLLRLRAERKALASSMKTEVTGLDLANSRLLRTSPDEPELLRVIDEVVAFAIPELQASLGDGRALRDELASRIQFGPVGVIPLDLHEGYLVLRQGGEARIYGFSQWVQHSADRSLRYHSIRTHYVGSRSMGPFSSYTGLRIELLRAQSRLPVPAMFAFEADVTLPPIETFLPLAKQLVYEELEALAA
jgi:hypothetical protein